jgi:uncharacterized protein YcbK (DUF882 family)
MPQPSPHLSWKELACKDGTPYPQEWRNNRAIILAELFEHIRKECGNKPIIVCSAFRTASHNLSIGGARYSQHLQGRALDLKHTRMNNIDFYTVIRELTRSKTTACRGIGRYLTFVHVDIRPSNRMVYWSATGTKDDN